MRDKTNMVMDRVHDKYITRVFRAVKEFNHAKSKKEGSRNLEVVVRTDGASIHTFVKNHKKESIKSFEENLLVHNEKFTKQFREINYIIRRVREYNEILGKKHLLFVYYTGDKLTIYKTDAFMSRSIIFEVDIMSMPYNVATKELTKISHKIKVMGGKL